MNKKIVFPALVLGVLGLAGVFTLDKVKAEDTSSLPPLVQRIVEKFNLNNDEVSTVMDQYREERQAERKENIVNRLTQAVADGKITEDQKNIILAKVTLWQTQMEGMRDLTAEERREKMDAHRTEMLEWEKSTGINLGDIIGRGFDDKGGMGKGFGEGRGLGDGSGNRSGGTLGQGQN